jgi:type II secretory pathway component GspD/PulD (secretin)
MRPASLSVRFSAFWLCSFSLFLLLAGGGCSTFGPAFDQPGPEAVALAEEEAAERAVDNAPVRPQNVTEEYPFVRFLRQTDGRLRAMIPVPLGAGELIVPVLMKNCPSLSREAEPAVLEIEIGYGVSGDPGLAPLASRTEFKPREDILALAGEDDDIREIVEFLDLYFNSAPQIEIQAQIVEVSNTDAFERGIQELTFQNLQDGNPFVYPTLDGNGNPVVDPNTGLWSDPTGVSRPGPFLRGFNTDFPFPSAGGGFELAIINKSYILDAFLKLVRTIEGADIVSRPRVVTRNGTAATLSSKERIPYQEFKNINTNGNSSATVGFLDVGVNLKVLPTLLGADTIHLAINAQVSRAGRLVAIAPDVFMPATTDRNAQTEVAVRDGQSVVIGGLMLNETRELESRVPLLGAIPLIGWFFSYRSTETTTSEVFFVITPVIKTRAASIQPFRDIFDPFADS